MPIYSTLPSADHVRAKTARYLNQRGEFTLLFPKDSHWKEFLEESGFDVQQPVKVNGIYAGVFKGPKDRSDIFFRGPTEFRFQFRDVLLKQGDKVASVGRVRSDFKRMSMSFLLEEIGSSALVERIRQMVPKLPPKEEAT